MGVSATLWAPPRRYGWMMPTGSRERIERRPWIAPGYLMRGAVTVIVWPWQRRQVLADRRMDHRPALGGAGIASAQAPRRGRSTTTPRMIAPEQQRRMSATLRQFDASPRDLAGK